MSASEDEFLDTDSEVNEFEQDPGVAQWEPDAWDGEDSEDGSDEDEETDDEERLRKGLAEVPLATLAKARKAMKPVSTYSEGESSTSARVTDVRARLEEMRGKKEGKGKRERPAARDNKNAPVAMSSKQQVSRTRQVIDLPKKDRRDPRFSMLSGGEIDKTLHSQSYDFLPQMLKDEFASLKHEHAAAVKAERTCALRDKESRTAERERLEKEIARTRSKIERGEREARERAALSGAKKQEMEKRKSGKGAWFMKKSVQRDLLLKSRFDALEADGGKKAVKKVLDRKRKKEAGKAKKSRPFKA